MAAWPEIFSGQHVFCTQDSYQLIAIKAHLSFINFDYNVLVIVPLCCIVFLQLRARARTSSEGEA